MSSSGMQTLYWLGIQPVQVISTCKGGLQAPPPPTKKGQTKPINLETCLVVVAVGDPSIPRS